MFEDLEVANKEYEDLKAKYDELVIAKNGADEKIKTYDECNTDEKEVMVASRKACIKININDIPTHSRGAQGVKAIKLALKDLLNI